MAALQCEICGGKLMGKPGGIFECDSCGMEYSTAWAKEKIQEIKGTVKVEGTVEVQGTVKVDGPIEVKGGVSVESLLKRGQLALEDGEWESADKAFDEVLNYDPECAEAYVGKLMVDLWVETRSELKDCKNPFDRNSNYQKAIRFADDKLKGELIGYIEHINARNAEQVRIEEEKRAAEQRTLEKKRADQRKPLFDYRDKISLVQHNISAGCFQSVGVNVDGTVEVTKYLGDLSLYSGQCEVSDWRDIVAVKTDLLHTVGLKSDGTVIATKYIGKPQYDFGQCNTENWKDIVSISISPLHTVGLKSDGTVVAVGARDDGQCNVSRWRDIVAVSAGGCHTVGLRTDGTVVAAGAKDNGRCDVSGWRDVVAVSAGGGHTVGLRADGTVVAIGRNSHGQCDVQQWENIAAISAGAENTVGLRADGTVVAVGARDDGRCDVSGWRNIVAVCANAQHTLGLKADGTVVATKFTGSQGGDCGQFDVTNWRLFNSLKNLMEERVTACKERKEKDRLEEQKRRWRSADKCQHCGGEFKGLFSKKCVSCGKTKDY